MSDTSQIMIVGTLESLMDWMVRLVPALCIFLIHWHSQPHDAVCNSLGASPLRYISPPLTRPTSASPHCQHPTLVRLVSTCSHPFRVSLYLSAAATLGVLCRRDYSTRIPESAVGVEWCTDGMYSIEHWTPTRVPGLLLLSLPLLILPLFQTLLIPRA